MSLADFAIPGIMPQVYADPVSIMHAGVAVFEVYRQPVAEEFPLFLCRTWSASERLGSEQIVTRSDGFVPLVLGDGTAIQINDIFYLEIEPAGIEEVVPEYPVDEIRNFIAAHGIVLQCGTGVQLAGADRDDNIPVNDSLITPKVEGDERVFYFIGRVLPGSWKQQVVVFEGEEFEEVVATVEKILSHTESQLNP